MLEKDQGVPSRWRPSIEVPRLTGGQRAETSVFLLTAPGPQLGSLQLRQKAIAESQLVSVNSALLLLFPSFLASILHFLFSLVIH